MRDRFDLTFLNEIRPKINADTEATKNRLETMAIRGSSGRNSLKVIPPTKQNKDVLRYDNNVR